MFGINEMFYVLIPIVVFSLYIFVSSVKIVSQSNLYVVERLGRYNKTLSSGFNLLIPFIERVVSVLSVKEQIIDIKRQSVITKDNVSITVDGIIFIIVQDAESATYKINDFKNAISNLAMTTIRSEIGKMQLDETLSGRSVLNTAVLTELDKAANNWGIKVMRVEISEISVPQEIEHSMAQQMKAERDKRAVELKASGEKEAVIREAEGQKQRAVLQAEAIERMAEAKSYEIEKVAEGEKKSILLINEALKENETAANYLLAKERIAAFADLAKSDSKDKIIVPYESTQLIGSLSMITDIFNGRK